MLEKLRGNNAKGFTLIELMIVIAIIGILMAIAIPNFIAYRDKSFCSAAESDANNVASTIADYFAIPTHTVIEPATDATVYLGFHLSGKVGNGQNTVDVTTENGGETIVIEVTDNSTRCPTDYMDAIDKWDSDTRVYTIRMD